MKKFDCGECDSLDRLFWLGTEGAVLMSAEPLSQENIGTARFAVNLSAFGIDGWLLQKGDECVQEEATFSEAHHWVVTFEQANIKPLKNVEHKISMAKIRQALSQRDNSKK